MSTRVMTAADLATELEVPLFYLGSLCHRLAIPYDGPGSPISGTAEKLIHNLMAEGHSRYGNPARPGADGAPPMTFGPALAGVGAGVFDPRAEVTRDEVPEWVLSPALERKADFAAAGSVLGLGAALACAVAAWSNWVFLIPAVMLAAGTFMLAEHADPRDVWRRNDLERKRHPHTNHRAWLALCTRAMCAIVLLLAVPAGRSHLRQENQQTYPDATVICCAGAVG